ncbi:hypothetical protein NQZ68_016137, partial [Dissostichus eleginoides]
MTPSLTVLAVTWHLLWPAGCTWLHPSDIRGSGERREVTSSDKQGGQWEGGR